MRQGRRVEVTVQAEDGKKYELCIWTTLPSGVLPVEVPEFQQVFQKYYSEMGYKMVSIERYEDSCVDIMSDAGARPSNVVRIVNSSKKR